MAKLISESQKRADTRDAVLSDRLTSFIGALLSLALATAGALPQSSAQGVELPVEKQVLCIQVQANCLTVQLHKIASLP
jgi:hypothetical protein